MSYNNVQILNFNHNIVEVGPDNKIVITDQVKGNSITIPQPVTNILQINSPGPQGPGLSKGRNNYIPLWVGSDALTSSYLNQSNNILKSTYNESDKGLKLDFANSNYSLGTNSNASLIVNNNTLNAIYSTYNGTNTGLYLDFINNNHQFISIDGSTVSIAQGQGTIKAANIELNPNYNASGFSAGGNITSIGDYNNNYNGTSITINDYTQRVQAPGLDLNLGGNYYQIGDNNRMSMAINSDDATIFIGDIQESYNGTTLTISDGEDHQFAQITNINSTGKLLIDFSNDLYEFGNITGGGGISIESNKKLIITSLGVAEGTETIANGNYSHAEGINTIANGIGSHAEGYGYNAEYSQTIANGIGSHAEGRGTIAKGDYSHAEGVQTTASGSSSHAEGIGTIAKGYYSHAEGDSTLASGSSSHAEGTETTAKGDGAHAEGYNTIAYGGASHAEGSETIASGSYSHTEGIETKAYGIGSHAEGVQTTASGSYSHAEGYQTTASGSYSHAEGGGTVTNASFQHAQGKYNIATNITGAFFHGNGTGPNNRSNLIYAHDSIVEITGSLQITGSLIMSPTSSFVLPLSSSLSPQVGSAYWSGSLLFVYNGTRYMSASFI